MFHTTFVVCSLSCSNNSDKIQSKFCRKVKSGAYVIKYVNKKVVAFKVLSISNAQLKLSTPQGDVLVYDKID